MMAFANLVILSFFSFFFASYVSHLHAAWKRELAMLSQVAINIYECLGSEPMMIFREEAPRLLVIKIRKLLSYVFKIKT
jgi:hypothetical protein